MTARDLERYAALFAARTQVMTSSAMRDLMAITERPEVISLAGGLPDTSTFPAEDVAAFAARWPPTARRGPCSTGPPRAGRAQGLHRRGHGGRGHARVDPDELLVTTGGQQVIDLVCKTLVDPGDVIVAEAPTYPGAVPAFTSYQADVVQIAMDDDGLRVDELEATLDRLEAEGRRPKFIYTIPTFQNPAGVTLSLERRRRLVEVARERELLVLEDNPYGLLRYEGEPLPTLRSLDGGAFVDLPRHVLEDPLARRAPGLGGRPAARCSRSSTSASRRRTCARRPSARASSPRSSPTATGRATSRSSGSSTARRRDVMLDALAEHLPPEAARRGRRAACSCGRRCRPRSTRPTCWPGRCRATSPSSPAARPTSTAAAATRCA